VKCREDVGETKEPKTTVEEQGELSDCPGVSSSEIDSCDVNETDWNDVKNEDCCFEMENAEDGEISFQNKLPDSKVQTACGSQVMKKQYLDELCTEKSDCGEPISAVQEQINMMCSAATVSIGESEHSDDACFKDNAFQGGKGLVFQGSQGDVFQVGKGHMFEGGKDCVFQSGKGDLFEGGEDCVFQGGKGYLFQGGKEDVFQGGKGDIFQGGKGLMFQSGKDIVVLGGKEDMFQGNECTSNRSELLTASNVSTDVVEARNDSHVKMETDKDCNKDDVSSTTNQEYNTSYPAWNCKQAPLNETSGTSPKSGYFMYWLIILRVFCEYKDVNLR